MSVEAAFEVGRLYGPIKAISDILTAPSKDVFIGLPGIEGYYPMSVVGAAGAAINHTGVEATLTQIGTVPVGYDGNSFRQLGNGTNYLSKADLYGLTGTKTFIDASIRGFTIGGWFMIEETPAENSGLISRSGVTPQIGYELIILTSDVASFRVSGNGTSRVVVNGTGFSLSEWVFIVGRFVASSEIAVFVNSVKTINTTSVPAAQFVSTEDFEVGRFSADDTRIPFAKVRDVFICRAALSDAIIESLRTATAP